MEIFRILFYNAWLFFVLKVTNTIDWSWFWVFFPIIIPFILVFILCVAEIIYYNVKDKELNG